MSNEEGGVQAPEGAPAEPTQNTTQEPTTEPTTEPAATPPTEPEPYTPSVEPEPVQEPSRFDALTEDVKQAAYDSYPAPQGAPASPQGGQGARAHMARSWPRGNRGEHIKGTLTICGVKCTPRVEQD